MGSHGCGIGAGGGLCLAGSPISSMLHLLDVSLDNNTADYGAGAFVTVRYAASTCPDPTKRTCYFAVFDRVEASNNAANQAGGVLYWTHENILKIARCANSTEYRTNGSLSYSNTTVSDPLLASCPDWADNRNNSAAGHGAVITSTPHSLRVKQHRPLVYSSNIGVSLNVTVQDYYEQEYVAQMPKEVRAGDGQADAGL